MTLLVTKAKYMLKNGLMTMTQVTLIKLHNAVISWFVRHENNVWANYQDFLDKKFTFLKFEASVLPTTAACVFIFLA